MKRDPQPGSGKDPRDKRGSFRFLAIEWLGRALHRVVREKGVDENAGCDRRTMSDQIVEKARIDRWLWSVRQFKTRGQATAACRGGKVRISDDKVKPSRSIKIGELVEIQQGPITKRLRVVELLDKRVGAKRVPEFMEDLTPPEEYELLRQTAAQAILRRDCGAGRPTKKERREIEELLWGE